LKYLLYLPILFLSLAFSEEIITFTNCGQEGRYGPSQEQCDGEYGGGVVNVVDGIQEWVVPCEDGSRGVCKYSEVDAY